MAGSEALFARGASQKKWASSAHLGPPVFFAFSMRPLTASESGFAGAAGGACAMSAAVVASAITIVFFTYPPLMNDPARGVANTFIEEVDLIGGCTHVLQH